MKEAATGGSIKTSVLKNFAKFLGKHLCQSLFFNKVTGLRLYRKETLVHVFSGAFSEILQNTFSTEHLRTAASVMTDTLFHYFKSVARVVNTKLGFMD